LEAHIEQLPSLFDLPTHSVPESRALRVVQIDSLSTLISELDRALTRLRSAWYVGDGSFLAINVQLNSGRRY
jgi:hypothetical protein